MEFWCAMASDGTILETYNEVTGDVAHLTALATGRGATLQSLGLDWVSPPRGTPTTPFEDVDRLVWDDGTVTVEAL
jgi:hypothetical protein